jgi:hypothetical protein
MGKIFENLLKIPLSQKRSNKVTLHVFIGEILANMTQVSDVAPGPLVELFPLTGLKKGQVLHACVFFHLLKNYEVINLCVKAI